MLYGPNSTDSVAKQAETLATLTKHGLGNKRTLDQLIEFTGIDLRSKQVFADRYGTRTVYDYCMRMNILVFYYFPQFCLCNHRCKPLEWVPFTADRDPYTVDNDVWGLSPEILTQVSHLYMSQYMFQYIAFV